jgi:riboflavin kinase/FMN adenylyltransferase
MIVLRSIEHLAKWDIPAVVFTIGFFDGVHRGHQALLAELNRAAHKQGAASLAVTFSNSPRSFHNPGQQHRYITTHEEKLLLLADCGVNATMMLDYDASVASQDAARFIRSLGAHVPLKALCIGYDSTLGCDQVGGREGFTTLASELGLGLVFVEALADAGNPVKSSQVRRHVLQGEMQQARQLLGHPYCVLGVVQRGKGKGRARLGVPTANLVLPAEKLAPAPGVYACRSRIRGKHYPAAVCVMSGVQHVNTPLEKGERNPAPAKLADVVVEAHLVGYDGDLYGKYIRLDFIEHLREWRDFATPESLHAQIKDDIARAVKVLEQGPGLLEDGDE